MSPALHDRLFGVQGAFASPVTVWVSTVAGALLALTPLIIWILSRRGIADAKLRADLTARWRSWLIIAPLMVVPVLVGPAFTIVAVCLLSQLCYREFARATGLFRERSVSVTVVISIMLITFASLDHWYGLFMALTPLSLVLIAVVAILPDRPDGYIQRVSLAGFAFLFFAAGLGHLGYLANDASYRPLLLSLMLCVELSDVAAYVCGKSFGNRKLAPHTSPNKTIGGSAGSLVFTTILTAVIGHYVFFGTALDTPTRLAGLGLIVAVLAQLGDLMLSSVKRDLGIKDLGAVFPGHGGLLDRFDSLVLVAPAVFHYIGYFNGVGLDQPVRLITGP